MADDKWRKRRMSGGEDEVRRRRKSEDGDLEGEEEEEERSSSSSRHHHHHSHKSSKHHKKDRKNRKERERSRSKSPRGRRRRERSEESPERGKVERNRKGDKYRGRSKSLTRRDHLKNRRSRECDSDRQQEKYGGNSRRLEHDTSNDDEELDLSKTVQPFASGGSISPAASKLKAEIEKRKQLWSKKDAPVEKASSPTSSSAVWQQTAFSGDNDGKVSAKFKRLMGIKEDERPSTAETSSGEPISSDTNRQDYFANLEKQYEVARATTHTQRGLGLGFSSRLFPK